MPPADDGVPGAGFAAPRRLAARRNAAFEGVVDEKDACRARAEDEGTRVVRPGPGPRAAGTTSGSRRAGSRGPRA